MARFQDLESRVNSACIKHLANATATIGAASVDVIFDNAHAGQQIGTLMIEATGPIITCKTTDLPTTPRNTPITVRSVNYLITEHQPDGTGMSVCLLQKA